MRTPHSSHFYEDTRMEGALAERPIFALLGRGVVHVFTSMRGEYRMYGATGDQSRNHGEPSAQCLTYLTRTCNTVEAFNAAWAIATGAGDMKKNGRNCDRYQ